MTLFLSRLARGLCLATVLAAGAAQAQPAHVPERKLEARWQTEILPEPGQQFDRDTARLRVQDDGRISFGLTLRGEGDPRASADEPQLLLVTVDGNGRIAGRVPVKGPGDRNHNVVAMQGGDFLVHVEEDESAPGMALRRIAADGAVRGTWLQAIDPHLHSRLVDAMVRDDGLVVAAVSLGFGPNDVLAVIVLGADGRPLSDHRQRALQLGQDYVTRVYPRPPGADDQPFDILAGGSVRPNTTQMGHFLLSFSLASSVVTADLPVDLGPEVLLCSALSREGHMVLGLAVPDNDRYGLLRWFTAPVEPDWKQALQMQRPTPKVSACEIGLNEDGSGAVWLAPRQLLAFGTDSELRWRATLDADAIGVAWMPDGDVVAMHVTDAGLRLVRYSPR